MIRGKQNQRARGAVTPNSPSLLLDFAKGAYTASGGLYTGAASVPGYSFTRSSGGYAETVAGDLTWFTGTRTNIIAYSQNMTLGWQPQTGGGGSAITTTANYSAAPDGTTTATRLQYMCLNYCQIFEYLSATNATPYTFSVWLKSNTSSNQTLKIGDQNITLPISLTVTPAWQRFSITQTTNSTAYIAKITGEGVGNFDFLAWGAQLETATDTRITYPTAYIPTTTAAVSVDTPRITNKGYLSEEARTNLVTYSQDLTNAAWAKNAVTALANQTTSPDGTVTASSMTETTATAQHYTSYATAKAASAITYSVSVYVKQFGLTRNLKFGLFDGAGNGVDTIINPVTLAVVSGPTYYGALPFTSVSVTTSTSSNGFVRIGLIFTSNVTPVVGFGIQTAIGTGLSFAGDASTGFYVWGAQLEAGAFATSYIPTTTAAATRAADILKFTSISSWYNQTAGTLAVTTDASANSYTTYVAATNGVTAQNSVHIDNDTGNMRAVYYSGSAAVATLVLDAIGTVGALTKIATAYAVNDFSASRNGGAVVTNSSGALPVSISQLNVGNDPAGVSTQYVDGYIKNVSYYNTRLSNAQLQAITA